MGFLKRVSGSLVGNHLANPRPDLFKGITYQHMTSNRGLPMIGLNLMPARAASSSGYSGVSNHEMTLALLVDRSGSMREAYQDGHVMNAASTILDYVTAAGSGFDLVFYDNTPSYAGHIAGTNKLATAIRDNPPRGGTYVTEALRGTIERYKKRAGIYIIVITDGEFADKTNVQNFVVNTLLPHLSPEHPYAFRLHFIGAGEGVDREFLEQLERAASGQGIQLVKQHHHAHLRHSHDSMLDELDGAFIGYANDATLGERNPDQSQPAIVTRVGNLATGQWVEGRIGTLGFVPKRAQLGIEVNPEHPPLLDAVLRFSDRSGSTEIPLHIPLPRTTATAAPPAPAPAKGSGFHLPWRRAAPEEAATKEAAAQERAALAQRIQAVHQAELQRQQTDLQLLGRGGIPTMAHQRLTELLGADPEHATFTSDLSPDEAALLRRNGYRAIGLVCGSAMYHVGTAYASAYGDCEVDVLTQAYNEATRLAAGRMQQEATALEAHGVVGVRFDIVRHEWSEKSIEVQFMGTAIAGQGRPPEVPWLSDLSGQEWFALHRAGYDPAGLVWGHCTWFVLTTQQDEWSDRSIYNQELRHFSDALTQCRNRANAQVRAMARQMDAVGVVGVHIARRIEEIHLSGPGENPAYEREHHNLTLSLIGTAIKLRPDAPERIRATGNVLSLRDGRMVPQVVTTTAATFE